MKKIRLKCVGIILSIFGINYFLIRYIKLNSISYSFSLSTGILAVTVFNFTFIEHNLKDQRKIYFYGTKINDVSFLTQFLEYCVTSFYFPPIILFIVIGPFLSIAKLKEAWIMCILIAYELIIMEIWSGIREIIDRNSGISEFRLEIRKIQRIELLKKILYKKEIRFIKGKYTDAIYTDLNFDIEKSSKSKKENFLKKFLIRLLLR